MENHILIVDDNLNNLRIAVDILMSGGKYRISTARSGIEALKVLEKTYVDIILVDINMPNMNGFDLTLKIKENDQLQDVPILFVTSHNDEVYLEQAFEAGCVDFIVKPYRPTEFLSRIKTHLALTNHKRHLEELVKEKTHELENTIKELRESQRAKEDFISVMSHELRTPLSGIMGMIELLKIPDFQENREEFLRDIELSAQKLAKLICDILDYSTIDAPSKLYETRTLTSYLVEQIELMVANRCSDTIDFQMVVADDLPEEVVVDCLSVLKAMEAIVDNAFKFTVQGVVCINVSFNKLSKNKGEISLMVSDNGHGIPPEYHDKIFEKFFQIDSGVNRLFEGTGLGLAITKKICDSLNIRLHVDSSPGNGSTFSLAVPVTITEAKTKADSYKPISEATVLIVEDFKTNQVFLKKILGLKKCKVLVAENHQECFEILEGNDIDLIFMDLMLPEVDGVKITQTIRNSKTDLSALPIIAISAKADDHTRAQCIQSGMNSYIARPFSATDIFAVLAHFFCIEK